MWQESMRRCFVGVGLSEDRKQYPETGFKVYNNHRRGTMAIKTQEECITNTCLGQLVTELDTVQRDGAESDEEEDKEESDRV